MILEDMRQCLGCPMITAERTCGQALDGSKYANCASHHRCECGTKTARTVDGSLTDARDETERKCLYCAVGTKKSEVLWNAMLTGEAISVDEPTHCADCGKKLNDFEKYDFMNTVPTPWMPKDLQPHAFCFSCQEPKKN